MTEITATIDEPRVRSFIAARRLEYACVFLAGMALMLFLHAENRHPTGPEGIGQGEVGLAGHDSFYHTKMAALTWEHGLLHEFPWLKFVFFTNEGHDFVSHHYGFHCLLSPFVQLSHWLNGDYRLGAIWAIAASFGAILLMLDAILVSQNIRWRWVWLFFILALPAQFFIRHSFVRAISPSLLFQLLIIWAMLRGRFVLLAVCIGGYVHVYLGGVIFGPLLVILYAMASVVGPAGDREVPWRLILWAIGGWIAGLCSHPYLSGMYEFLVMQVFCSGLSSDISVGREWKAYQDVWWFAQMCGPLMLAWVVALCLRIRMGPRLGRVEMFFLLAHFVFLTLTFKARRFIEYWPMFALISSACLINPIVCQFADWFDRAFDRPLEGRLSRRRVGMAIKVSALTACAVLLAFGAAPQWQRTQRKVKCVYDLPAIRDAMTFLKENSSEGDVVFTDDWDVFPVYFFYNSHNHYIVGLDPKFTQGRLPELWRRYVKISRGQVPASESVLVTDADKNSTNKKIDIQLSDIRTHFGAKFVITDKDHKALAGKLSRAKKFAKQVYPSDTETGTKSAKPPYRIFRILDDADGNSSASSLAD